ncbi:MAG: hypothetical protein PHS92_00835 [Candidatus Gracilibacteria bacterium]|nr:hypothetical protein [Candidatus Gracilibacteria bacterium]
MKIYYNGLAQEEGDIVISGNMIDLLVSILQDDILSIDINYFYIKADNKKILSFLIDDSYSDKDKSTEIISKHYSEGQFSLDNGLYKDAVLNFGTVLEGILNKGLEDIKLWKLIKEYSGNADKESMKKIQGFRNKVHPNLIKDFEDISREDAIEARNLLEILIYNFFKDIK